MTKWLSADEQQSWRSFIAAWTLLNHQLNDDLQSRHGLTIADYEILVRLSETQCRRMRMSELAESTLASRSRLSHQVGRMEAAGLVTREECTEDRRGSFAVLTEAGWQALADAAPAHVTGVRTHLVDVLSKSEFKALGDACQKITTAISQESD
ncbi:MAG: MarR family transcriptional regulator [Candidatus Nanopelagicales bacterium]|nr:MarR family transcriptional regulator [Candidatus Nanopelagicales bacterium]